GDGFAIAFVGQAEIRAVARIFGLMTMAVRFAASAGGGSDRATAQIAKSRDLIGDVGPLVFEGFQGFWGAHRDGLLILAYYIRTDLSRKKRIQQIHHFQVVHPTYVRDLTKDDAERFWKALKPGGIVVYENGADESNSVLRAFLRYQIIRFEDLRTTPEWNPENRIRVQRLIAQKTVK
ncbi:MAG: hypothetical protein ABI165_10860, partial [Bryobacteraceae bacterium]